MHEGGLIPKTLYKSMSDEDAENNAQTSTDPCQNSLYKSVDLKPGQIHELIIKNNDPKSVLTWDFDVVRSDLHFTVFRTIKSVSHMNGKVKLLELVKGGSRITCKFLCQQIRQCPCSI